MKLTLSKFSSNFNWIFEKMGINFGYRDFSNFILVLSWFYPYSVRNSFHRNFIQIKSGLKGDGRVFGIYIHRNQQVGTSTTHLTSLDTQSGLLFSCCQNYAKLKYLASSSLEFWALRKIGGRLGFVPTIFCKLPKPYSN